MTLLETSHGVVRASSDGWGVGLYSTDDQYRYWFLTPVDPRRRPGIYSDVHDDGLPVVGSQTLVWVGLNPSRSDDNGKNRATLRSVLHWAERAGLDQVLGINLYAYRHSDPRAIRRGLRTGDLERVIGEQNEAVLHHVSGTTAQTLLAWGSYGTLGARGAQVAARFPQGQCVGVCANGEPFHPARKSRSLELMDYQATG